MQVARLTKYGELKRIMSIDPKDASEETFKIDSNGKNVLIKATELIPVGENLYSITLAAVPKASKYDAIVVELNAAAALQGAICSNIMLKDGETPSVVIRSSDEDIGETILGLPWVLKCSALKGVKV